MLHEELTRKIIGCAMEVHKRLGNGFQEVIYQRALEIEMNLAHWCLQGKWRWLYFTGMLK